MTQPSSIRARPARRLRERAAVAACALAALLPLGALLWIIVALLGAAAPRLSWHFIVGVSGLAPAVLGSLAVLAVAALIALPIGVAAAVYIEEYLEHRRLRAVAERVITHLSGVPSVVYGLLGLALFVRAVGLRSGAVVGGATMALVVLPMVVINTRAALRAVPPALREASFALGATRWATVRHVVLPNAAPEIVARATLALIRAVGEAAPLLVVGAVGYGVGARASGAAGGWSALPVQAFAWLTCGDTRHAADAAAAMVVLLLMMLLVGALGLYLRRRLARRLT